MSSRIAGRKTPHKAGNIPRFGATSKDLSKASHGWLALVRVVCSFEQQRDCIIHDRGPTLIVHHQGLACKSSWAVSTLSCGSG